jgi:hypothetical protein
VQVIFDDVASFSIGGGSGGAKLQVYSSLKVSITRSKAKLCYLFRLPKQRPPGIHVFVPLYRTAEPLVVGDKRVGRGAVEDIRHDVDGKTIELVQGILGVPVRENTD